MIILVTEFNGVVNTWIYYFLRISQRSDHILIGDCDKLIPSSNPVYRGVISINLTENR